MTEQTTTETTEQTAPEPADDALSSLPAEKLAGMLRDKRKAEASARTRAGQAEAERDRLSKVVGAWTREKLHGLALAAGVLPSALADLDDRIDPSGLLTEGGTLDEDKAAKAFTTLKAERPHYFEQRKPAGASGVDHPGGGGEGVRPPVASWTDVISGG